MLQPKRTKYRKVHKGRNYGLSWSGNAVSFGEFGLKATAHGQLTARQIEVARRSISRYVKRGEDIEKLRKEVSDVMGVPAHINVTEVRKPELDAQLVAESIAQQLERRIMFRRAMKRAVGNAMRLGALGIKVNVGGRLNGAEIARSEWYREGRVPLHTLRADIDYGFAEAKTTYGIIGIKVWVYKGEVFDFSQVGQEKQDDTPAPRAERGDRERPRGPRRDREARD